MNVLELRGQVGHELSHLLGIADIELDRQHLDAVADLLLDVGGDLVERVDTAGREDQLEVVLRRRPGELEGGAAANAGASAGNHHGLALEAFGSSGGGHGSFVDVWSKGELWYRLATRQEALDSSESCLCLEEHRSLKYPESKR